MPPSIAYASAVVYGGGVRETDFVLVERAAHFNDWRVEHRDFGNGFESHTCYRDAASLVVYYRQKRVVLVERDFMVVCPGHLLALLERKPGLTGYGWDAKMYCM
jgi:hypothetical protein